MRMSTRARYGFRAMLELAEGFQKGPIPLRTIAEHQDISGKYLHALLTILKNSGFVRTIRGPGGGYVLTRHPSRINAAEVIRALEGSLAIVGCVDDKRFCKSNRANGCVARCVWQDLTKTIETTLSGLNLTDVILCAPEDRQRSRRISAAVANRP